MSLIGKTNNGFFKQTVKESRSIARVAKSLKFAHKAAAGEASINLTALSVPSDMVTNGFVQPSVADLTAAKLLTNRNNLRLKSNVRGELEEFKHFTVTGDTVITFISPFVSLVDEEFIGVISDNVRTGYGLLDAMQFAVTTTLAASATDITLGVPVPITGVYGSQVPSILVFRSGQPMVQNVSNSPSGEGNYYLVPQIGGSSSLLRFNEAGNTGGEPVIIVPIGNMPFLGTDSMVSVMDAINGAVNAMKPYLADTCGVDPSVFGSNPTQSDLRQFGDTVIAHTATLADHETRIDALEQVNEYVLLYSDNGYGSTNTKVRKYSSVISAGTSLSYTQSATLGDSVTVNATGVYEISGNVRFTTANETTFLAVNMANGTTTGPFPFGNTVVYGDSGPTGSHANFSRMVRLQAGDIVRLVTFSASVTSANASPQFLSVIRVN